MNGNDARGHERPGMRTAGLTTESPSPSQDVVWVVRMRHITELHDTHCIISGVMSSPVVDLSHITLNEEINVAVREGQTGRTLALASITRLTVRRRGHGDIHYDWTPQGEIRT